MPFRLPERLRSLAFWRGDVPPPPPVVSPLTPGLAPIDHEIDWDRGKYGDLHFSRADLDKAMGNFAVGDAKQLLGLAAALNNGDRRLELTELLAAGREATADLTRGFTVGPANVAEVMRTQQLDSESLLLRLARRIDDGDRVIEPHELDAAAAAIKSIVAANDVKATYDRIYALADHGIQVEELGRVGNRNYPILATHFPVTSGREPELRVCITGGVHGNEPAGTGAALLLAEWLAQNPKLRERVEFTVIPMVNPRGLEDGTRRTPEDADVNRSLGPNAQVETEEGKIVSSMLASRRFDLGIDLHSGSPKRNGFWLMHNGAEDLLGPVMKAFDVEWPILSGDVRPYQYQRPGVLISRNKGTMKDEFVRHGARWGVTVEAPRSLGYFDRVVGEVELVHRIIGSALGRGTLNA